MNTVLNKLHHICLVVHNIDKTQAYYESIGIGPWTAYPPLSEYAELQVPHRDGFLNLQYRICNLPNVQLQLCQPSAEPSPQRLHLDAKGEGVFHVGFEVADADSAEEDAKAHGLTVLMRGRRVNRSGFTYYDTGREAAVNLLTRATNQASS